MRATTDRTKLTRFLDALGRRLRLPIRFYLVGGSVVIDLGLREATLDIDYVAEADDPRAMVELERAIRELKDELDVNIEPASPADFLPVPASVLGRSRFVGQHGRVAVYHYHPPTLVIAKVARGLEQDFALGGHLETWRETVASPTGWLRHDPAAVARRLDVLRQRLGVAPPDR
ncbi:MAG: hypothetical protein AVDCRST_MAG73-445 [uncultured Thermomicrobiales bacterium]|uniref:Uncharacterized protein n=1 Tax=uncultured Thermomicrobiales bacterium TaxID=1645740 RepID=A0A6J4TL27_9BACT|nr:MAG: hypothetical protein AVDCRST_MAG73-445 [uncultured Thermomicrobiales bacterium]